MRSLPRATGRCYGQGPSRRSSARLSSTTLTPFSPRMPRARPGGVVVEELVRPRPSTGPAPRPPAPLAAARSRRRCAGRGPSPTRSPRRPAPRRRRPARSAPGSPRPAAPPSSGGRGWSARGWSRCCRWGRSPAAVSPLAPAAADGRDWKYSGSGSPFWVVNACPMSDEPTARPLHSMIEPSALSWNSSCPTPRTTSGKPMPSIDGEDHHGDDRRDELASHHFTPSAVTMMSMSLMPMNGAITPPAP